MKKILITLFLMFTLSIIYAQIPYYDALKLSKLLDANKHFKNSAVQKDSLFSILSNYLGDRIKSPSDFRDSLKNPFIFKYFDAAQVYGTHFSNNVSPSILSSIGGLDVTNIADGIAKFLVKRTKEELNVAFFSKFKQTLNSKDYADLKVLFPNTWELLDAIGDEIYEYNKYIQNLREAFQCDIKTLDQNLPGIIPNHKLFFDSHFEYAASLNTSCYITRSLRQEIHPGVMLNDYPMKYLKKEGDNEYFDKNWSGAIQTLQLVSESLRDTSSKDENYWVPANKVRELINNKSAFEIYLGLIYQIAKTPRYNSIEYKHGSLVELMKKVKFETDYPAYKNYISNFAVKLDGLNEMIKKHTKPANDSIAIENYAKYIRSTVDMLEYCTQITELPHFETLQATNFTDNLYIYFKIINETSDLAIDINRRNYSSSINHTLTIYNLVRTKVLAKEFKATNNKLVANSEKTSNQKRKEKAEKSYNEALNNFLEVSGVQNKDSLKNVLNRPLIAMNLNISDNTYKIKELQDSLNLSKDILQKFARYGTFMATIATAKTSDEIEVAIESAALPSGSSRIKRETPFNVSLNAYTGLFMGHEWISGVKDSHGINSYGLTAPIGVAISTGSRKFLGMPCHKEEKHWSYSAFISLIDIGAVAAFRFQNNDSVSQVPTIKLQDIFSPGLFFSIGFPKCPLSFNMGAQVGPNLRNVYVKDTKNTGQYINTYQDNVYWRFSASIVVDIPLLNFYTKSK